MERWKALRAKLEAWTAGLSPRERVMVTIAAVAVVLFVVLMASQGLARGVASREARLEDKTRVLGQIGTLSAGYRAVQAERQAMEARLKGPPVALMSHVSQAGSALGIEVTDLRPTGAPTETEGVLEESVEVNLPRIDLPRLARLLEGLERSAGLVKVRRLRVSTRSDDPRLVDVTVVVASYRLKA
jgi:general secretion pathway protein M